MKQIIYLALIFLLVLSSCYMPDESELLIPQDENTQYESVEIVEGLEAYRCAELENVITEGKSLEYQYTYSLRDSITVLQSLFQFPVHGLLESLGLTWDEINGENVRPRSAAATLQFELRNEGFEVKVDNNTASAMVDYLDLIAKGDTIKLIRYILDKVDTVQWANTTTINGNIGLSTFLTINGNSTYIPKAEAGIYLGVDAKRLGLRKVPVIDAFIPNTGLADIDLRFSFASSTLTVSTPLNPNIGYPDLSGEQVYTNYYAPYFVSLQVRPITGMDISKVYSMIYDMLVTQSEIIAKANYDKIVSLIWPEHTENNIVLEISMLNEDGSTYTVDYKDYDLVSLIRMAMGAV